MQRSDSYRTDVVARIVGTTPTRLAYWDKTGLLSPSLRPASGRGSRRRYSFGDLVELKVILRFRALGITMPTLRKAVRYIRQHYAELVRPLAQLALVTDGKLVLIRTENGKIVDATKDGQVVMRIALAPIASQIEGQLRDLSTPQTIRVRVGSRVYQAVLTPDLSRGGFTAEVPSLPGVITEGDTLPETKAMLSEAIRLWLDVAPPKAKRKAV